MVIPGMIPITVPANPGFASGDFAHSSNSLPAKVFWWVIDQVRHLRILRSRKKSDAKEKESRTLYARDGEGPDGSRTKHFEPETSLRQALKAFGLNVEGAERFTKSDSPQFWDTPLRCLTLEEINAAINCCHMADW